MAWMHRVRSFMDYPKRSLRMKLFLFFVMVATIPLLILGYLSFSKSSEVVESQMVQYGQSTITQLEAQVDSYSRQMQATTRFIYSYLLDPISNVLDGKEPTSYSDFLAQANFNRLLDSHKTLDTTGIYVITPSGYYYGSPQIDVDQMHDQKWWQEIPEDYKGAYWTGIHGTSPYLAQNLNLPKQVIGLVFPMLGQYGSLMNSKIVVEMDASKLMTSFDLIEHNLHSYLTITDRSGRVIYQTNANREEHADDLVWKKELESNHWTIEVRTPFEPVFQETLTIRYFTIALIGFALLLSLLVSYFFSARITRRIISLKNNMQLVGIGKFHSRIEPETEDELGRLGGSFNKMVEQIEDLIEEVKLKEQLKKEAELRAYHYQINPHLLLNTLNMIQWQAKMKGDEDIRGMIYHLTKVLEGNLVITEELISIEREMYTVDHYLKIQEARYGLAFHFQFDCDKALFNCLIPRMTLQPLLENTFFHGFEDGQGNISLQMMQEGENLVLVLKDDGQGIAEDRLKTLLTENQPRALGSGGLGCFNVDQKFKLHFGRNFGMEITSEENKGTTITIRWPRITAISVATTEQIGRL
ncbi:sensor histidine kinase [Paenibacillus guangzhouensis]|uniref:sensor histidine kinase n=1 Tax=Paenibacillus guangzhouensis TaxID=1473112 RepID=UPI00187B918E|nr:sensor histidine kinase [Paenibacillus guangzhouensis]